MACAKFERGFAGNVACLVCDEPWAEHKPTARQPEETAAETTRGGGTVQQVRASSGKSLAEAKREYFEGAETSEGTRCPCCERYGKVYRRKLNATMAAALVRLHALTHNKEREWFDPKEFTLPYEGGEYGKLQFWELVVTQPSTDPKRKGSSKWKITDKGKKFVRGELKVPAYAVVYDGELRRLEGPPLAIVVALGSVFSYAELMAHGGRL